MRKRSVRRASAKQLGAGMLNEVFLPAQVALGLLDTRHFRADQATELAFFLDLAQLVATDRRNAAVCRAAGQAMSILIRLRDKGVETGDWGLGESDRQHLIDAIVVAEHFLRGLRPVALARALQKLMDWSSPEKA